MGGKNQAERLDFALFVGYSRKARKGRIVA